jgi:uncharacterized damage-inducible protein DinB
MPHDRPSLIDLYDYTTFTWAAYGRAVATLPQEKLAEPIPGSGWQSLRHLLFHIALAWDGWLVERLGLNEPLDATPEAITSWDDVGEHRQRARGWLRRVIAETPDEELSAPSLVFSAGTPTETRASVADVIAHILLHERGHHGDVTTLLHTLGATPPSVDYLVYLYFKQRRQRANA